MFFRFSKNITKFILWLLVILPFNAFASHWFCIAQPPFFRSHPLLPLAPVLLYLLSKICPKMTSNPPSPEYETPPVAGSQTCVNFLQNLVFLGYIENEGWVLWCRDVVGDWWSPCLEVGKMKWTESAHVPGRRFSGERENTPDGNGQLFLSLHVQIVS